MATNFRKTEKMQKSIDALFAGLDDPIMKQVLLTAYAGANPKILEEMQAQEQKYFEELTNNMEITNAASLVGESKTILSNDNVADGISASQSTIN